MLLLHVSDIHFRSPECKTPELDSDRPFRTRLVQDVRERAGELGAVGAILVTGDIAFKADPDEYVAALEWLRELADACGCQMERVFVVPGNHDVDRSVIAKKPAVKNVHQAIVGAQPEKRERVLLEQFRDETTGRALFEPLAAYNEFAKIFNCQVYSPERLYWKQDILLEHDVCLRLNGLTSTLVSGQVQSSGSQNDIKGSLYLSPLQTVLDPVDDVVNLVLAHHPPDWFMDHDEVDDNIQGRAALHLFGHKHRQRVATDHQYMRFSAGAVNPDKQEAGWAPGFNLIKLTVVADGQERQLHIEAHVLLWQTSPDMFRPKLNHNREKIFRHRIGLPGKKTVTVATPTETIAQPPAHQVVANVEVMMSDQATRNLVMRFWNLSSSQRREISLELGLIDRSEIPIPEPERYGRALIRAGERRVLEKLAEEIEKREKR